MNSATYRELLKHNRNFRHLWAGQFISELGTWFSFIAELGVVRLLSDSALVTTALLVARMLPFLLAAPIAGVITDRWSRKRILVIADFLRAAAALVYLAAIPLKAPWIVIACSALISSISMFFEAAKNAAMPNMVSSRELLTANVMMFSTRFLQYMLGAALGGVTAAQFGYDAAFIVNSFSFIASAVFILVIPDSVMKKTEAPISSDAAPFEPLSAERSASAPIAGSEQPLGQSAGRFFSDVREGIIYIWATPFVRGVILANIGWATGGGMVNLLFDQMGGHTFAHSAGDEGDWNVAALFTASGAGLFLGMMLARRAGAWAKEERRAGLFIGWSLVAQGALMAAAGLMPSLGLTALLVGAARLILGAEFGVQETFVMRVLPDEYRGRVFTTDRSLELATMSIATAASGWLIKWLDPRAVMIISGALSAVPGIVWLLAMSLTGFRVPSRAVRESYGD